MLSECIDRLYSSKMEYYRHVYRNSERWNGVSPISGKCLVIYCEQGSGDVIQFVRYVPKLKAIGARVFLHCTVPLHRLFRETLEIDGLIDRDNDELPDHDFHIPSFSLPFVLNSADAKVPYLKVTESEEIGFENKLRIGVAWEGNPSHSNNAERSCPLRHIARLASLDNVVLFAIQPRIHDADLIEGCENLDLYSVQLNDYYDTARLIRSLNLVVSVDTSVLHLAGAMGQKAIGLMSCVMDHRWLVHNWYPTLRIVKQREPGRWEWVIDEVITAIWGMCS